MTDTPGKIPGWINSDSTGPSTVLPVNEVTQVHTSRVITL